MISEERKLPVITVVTAVYNGAATLEATLHSVIEQTYPEIEYIVVDGGSTDGTVELLRRYSDNISVWRSEPDRGMYDAWNKAIALSSGSWFIFLGADDRLANKDVLSTLIEAAGLTRGVAQSIIYGNIEIVDPQTGAILERIRKPWSSIRNHYEFFKPSLPRFPEVLIHRTLMSGTNTFDPSYRIAGDARFLLQALRAGVVPLHVDILVTQMTHGGMSTDPKQLWRAASEVRRACRETGTVTPVPHRAKEWAKLLMKLAILRGLPQQLSRPIVNAFRRATGRGTLS